MNNDFNIINRKFDLKIGMEKLTELIINNRGEKVTLSDSFYYHATYDDIYILDSIYKRGLLCRDQLMQLPNFNKELFNGPYNGKDRISLTKKGECKNSAYNAFVYKNPSFIIDDKILTFKVPFYPLKIDKHKLGSVYEDEWQTYNKITPDHFVAVGIYFMNRLGNNVYTDYAVLSKTYNVITWMDTTNVPLDFIDLSDNTIINKQLIKENVRRKRFY